MTHWSPFLRSWAARWPCCGWQKFFGRKMHPSGKQPINPRLTNEEDLSFSSPPSYHHTKSRFHHQKEAPWIMATISDQDKPWKIDSLVVSAYKWGPIIVSQPCKKEPSIVARLKARKDCIWSDDNIDLVYVVVQYRISAFSQWIKPFHAWL